MFCKLGVGWFNGECRLGLESSFVVLVLLLTQYGPGLSPSVPHSVSQQLKG